MHEESREKNQRMAAITAVNTDTKGYIIMKAMRQIM